jgi:hypothetical protein
MGQGGLKKKHSLLCLGNYQALKDLSWKKTWRYFKDILFEGEASLIEKVDETFF